MELWSKDLASCEKRILPIANRLVIFSVSDLAYHGYPDPVDTPEGLNRRSLSLYYYGADPAPNTDPKPHKTLWQNNLVSKSAL